MVYAAWSYRFEGAWSFTRECHHQEMEKEGADGLYPTIPGVTSAVMNRARIGPCSHKSPAFCERLPGIAEAGM
jgi:hypothetical protein